MKNVLLMGSTLLAALVVMTSCKQETEPYVEPEVDVEGYYAIATMSVPCGTQEVMVETYALDANGNKTDIQYQKVPVTPQVATPTGGKAVEPFGEVTLLLNAPNKTMASVYYTISGTVQVKSDAYEDRTRQPKYVVENLPIAKPGKNVTTKAEMQLGSCPNSAGILSSESEMERNPEVPSSTRDEALLYYTTPSGVPRGPSQLHSISVFSEAP